MNTLIVLFPLDTNTHTHNSIVNALASAMPPLHSRAERPKAKLFHFFSSALDNNRKKWLYPGTGSLWRKALKKEFVAI